jgi:hypothetical protein
MLATILDLDPFASAEQTFHKKCIMQKYIQASFRITITPLKHNVHQSRKYTMIQPTSKNYFLNVMKAKELQKQQL